MAVVKTMDDIEPKNIVVIRGGGLGDFILIFPLLMALRRTYPYASIHILGNPEIAALASEVNLADKIFALDSAETLRLFQDYDFSYVNTPILQSLKTADLAISFLGNPGGIMHLNLEQLVRKVTMVRPPKIMKFTLPSSSWIPFFPANSVWRIWSFS